MLLGSDEPSPSTLDALSELPEEWDVALFDPGACPKTVEPVRRCLWPDGSNCGEVAYTRWALCDAGGALVSKTKKIEDDAAAQERKKLDMDEMRDETMKACVERRLFLFSPSSIGLGI